ncbi:MAG: terminase family protein [Nitrososphaerota archaeon]
MRGSVPLRGGQALYRRLIELRREREAAATRVPEDAVEFAVSVLNWRPFAYQEELLSDPSKRICVCAARQTGKSTTVAVKALHLALSRKGARVLLVAPTLRQSLNLLEKISEFVRGSETCLKLLRAKRRSEISFRNGSRIVALPSGTLGSTIRGLTADLVIVDEAAFVPEPVITDVLMPQIATTDGHFWMVSTPWDRNHVFYRCFTDPGWSVKRWPATACPLIRPSFIEEQRRLMGEEAFRREMLAEFVDDASSFFPSELIRSCIEDYQPGEVGRGRLYAGFDWGGRADPNALAVVEADGGTLRLVHTELWMSESYTYSVGRVVNLYRQMGFDLALEEIGAGIPIREQLESYGIRVIGVGPDEVERAMIATKVLMEGGRLRIYLDDALISSLQAVKFERTRRGRLVFHHPHGTRDDLARALALACYASTVDSTGSFAAAIG